MRESRYQADVIKRLHDDFPGCMVLKNDSEYCPGIPDLVMLYRSRWAMLEVKRSAREPNQPNQEYYVQQLDAMSFAAFIYPENEEEVFDALQRAFRPRRPSRVLVAK